MNSHQIISLHNIIPQDNPKIGLKENVACSKVTYNELQNIIGTDINQNGTTTILVLHGRATANINSKAFNIKSNSLLILTSSQIVQFTSISKDFCCMILLISHTFMKEMDPAEMTTMRVRQGAMFYNTPSVILEELDKELIKNRMENIHRALLNTTHLYYKQTILCNIIALFLDIHNIIERLPIYSSNRKSTREEKITTDFIELLTENYRDEHDVNFYADSLNITPHYLTRIVKRTTGHSVNELIFDMLYNDAKSLLHLSKYSVAQISRLLNFSDQSAFGKFFKRKSGQSPLAYRKLK